MPDSPTRPTADEEWNNLLHQWRTQQGAQPQPLFYNRVRARIISEASEGFQLLPVWLRWPSYAAMLGIMLMLSGDGAVGRSIDSANQCRICIDSK